MNVTAPSGRSIEALAAWARRLTDDLNRFFQPIDTLPTFADDVAAAAGSLKVGQGYVTPTGEVRRRIA